MFVRDILTSVRIPQWIKNCFVFAPLVFSQNIFNRPLLVRAAEAFLVFCILSGAAYLFNDLMDVEEDRQHPRKSRRPLASGRLKKSHAALAAGGFAAVGLGWALGLNVRFFLAAAGFVLIQTLYSLWLKHVVIFDAFLIAAGFLLRVIAGALAIEVEISAWLFICTVLLALFLALCKRRHELVFLEKEAESHRPILHEYSAGLLDQMIAVVTASTVISYCLYTISGDTVAKFGTRNLVLTVPFVLYGIFRYLYLVHQKDEGGSPESLIIRDKPLLVDVFLWVASAVLIIYV